MTSRATFANAIATWPGPVAISSTRASGSRADRIHQFFDVVGIANHRRGGVVVRLPRELLANLILMLRLVRCFRSHGKTPWKRSL